MAETSLHRDLKALYAGDGHAARREVRWGDYRIDVVTADELVEIQHGSLAAIRGKDTKPEIIDPLGGAANNQREAKMQRLAARQQTEKTYLVAKVEFPAPIRATPIVVNGVMYVMTESALYAIGKK